MQILTLKAKKENDSKYNIVLGSIVKKADGEYDAMLALMDQKKPKAKYEASDIHIKSKDISVIYEQIKEIAEIFPPVKKDVNVLDLTEMVGGDKGE